MGEVPIRQTGSPGGHQTPCQHLCRGTCGVRATTDRDTGSRGV